MELDVCSFLQALKTDPRGCAQSIKLLQAICYVQCHSTSSIVWVNVLFVIQPRTWLWTLPIWVFILYQLRKQLAVPLLFVLSIDQCTFISGITSFFHFFWTNQFTKWRLLTYFLYLIESLRWPWWWRHFRYLTFTYFIFITTNRRPVSFHRLISLTRKISSQISQIFVWILFRLEIPNQISVLFCCQLDVVINLKFNVFLYSEMQICLIVNLFKVFMLQD